MQTQVEKEIVLGVKKKIKKEVYCYHLPYGVCLLLAKTKCVTKNFHKFIQMEFSDMF